MLFGRSVTKFQKFKHYLPNNKHNIIGCIRITNSKIITVRAKRNNMGKMGNKVRLKIKKVMVMVKVNQMQTMKAMRNNSTMNKEKMGKMCIKSRIIGRILQDTVKEILVSNQMKMVMEMGRGRGRGIAMVMESSMEIT